MNRKKSDYRLENLMLDLGLPNFLAGIIEALEALGDEDDRTRRLRHGLRNLLKEYRKSDVDSDDDGC